MDPFVSVVVPTFNRRTSLVRMLGALAQQAYSAESFEVVVVDDGSTDGTAEHLRSLVLPYQLRILTQPNRGPAAARNLGVDRARGTLIVFLDDDVVPLPSLLAEHVAAQGAASDAVVVGPMSPPRDWPRPSWVRWEEDLLQDQYRAMLAGEYPCTPRQFYTANASLSRARFLKVGGFDARFKRAEDVELAFRLREGSARFIFNPRAAVMHYASRSLESWCRTPYQYGRYDVIMQRDKGHKTLQNALFEFRTRHPLNRVAARACVGRPILARATLLALRCVVHMAEFLGARKLAALALSGIFGLLYWQGVADELGGAEQVWHSIAATTSPAIV